MIKTLGMFEFGSWKDATCEFGSWKDATLKAGKMPTTTKCVDQVKKDEDGRTFVRCRLVARDFQPLYEGPRDDLFAALPPLEAKKALIAFVAGLRERRRTQGHDETKPMSIDAKKAHLNAKCDEEKWVELPTEFEKFGRYAKLKRWLYGMRKAASGWEDDHARRLVEGGFRRGRSASTIFYHSKTQVRVVVHGDELHEWYDVKVRGILGGGKRDVHEIEIVGRNLTWTEEGLEYEGSDMHRGALLEGVERAVEGGQQCSRETRGDWSKKGHGDVGRLRNKKIQEFGGDVELHELGQVGRAIRREGGVHEDGDSDSRQLEEAEEGRQVFEGSGESDVGDETVET